MQLIVDGHHLAFRHKHSHVGNLRTSDGRGSGVIYGFIRAISYVQRCVGVIGRDTIVVFDGGRAKFRKKIYPEYKSGRVKSDQTEEDREDYADFQKQLEAVCEVLDYLGVRVVKVAGCEADDLIGIMVQRGKDRGEQSVVFSGDKDFFQLLDDDVQIFHPDKDLLSREDVFQEFDVTRGEDWLWARTLQGDESDKIKGVRMLGGRTAFKVMNWMDDGCPKYSNLSQKLQERFYNGIKDMVRNMLLMRIPRTWEDSFYGEEERELFEEQYARRPQENVRAYHAFCVRWELKSLIDQA